MLFREIPFILFLQIIGVFSIEPEAEAFLSSTEQHGVTVDDLPGSLRAIVTGLRTKFRVGLKVIVHILCALGLLEPVPEPVHPGHVKSFPSDFELKYKMVKRVAFYNYIAKNQPFIRFFELRSEIDVKIFWAHLQYSCSDRRNEKGMKGRDEGIDDLNQLEPAKMKILAGIDNPRYVSCVANLSRNWNPPSLYTPAERVSLSAYTDAATGTSPYQDTRKCKVRSIINILGNQ
jgi:hypothetical protein